MGLATIDLHSQKEHTEIRNIPKFGVNKASFDRETAFGWPYISLRKFGIFKWLYLVYYWVYLHQTWGFCIKLGLHFMSMWINSC